MWPIKHHPIISHFSLLQCHNLISLQCYSNGITLSENMWDIFCLKSDKNPGFVYGSVLLMVEKATFVFVTLLHFGSIRLIRTKCVAPVCYNNLGI